MGSQSIKTQSDFYSLTHSFTHSSKKQRADMQTSAGGPQQRVEGVISYERLKQGSVCSVQKTKLEGPMLVHSAHANPRSPWAKSPLEVPPALGGVGQGWGAPPAPRQEAASL